MIDLLLVLGRCGDVHESPMCANRDLTKVISGFLIASEIYGVHRYVCAPLIKLIGIDHIVTQLLWMYYVQNHGDLFNFLIVSQ